MTSRTTFLISRGSGPLRGTSRMRRPSATPVIVGAIMLALAGGCGASSARSPSAHPDHVTGTVTGIIKFVGGPFPGHMPPQAGDVMMFNAAGRLVAHEQVRKGHHFRFVLKPGRYQLTLKGSMKAGPKVLGTCPRKKTLHVRAHRTTHVTFPVGCNVP